MATILLIRHGLNDFVGKRLAGRRPGVHLSEAGRRQAEQVATALRYAPIQAIYASPLERAIETAQPLAAAHNLEVIPHAGLIEIDFGAWQGLTMKQMQRRKDWKTVQERPSQMRFPGGESFAEAQERIVCAIEEINAAIDEKSVAACFSHSDAIRLAMAHFLAMPLDAFQRVGIDTASISALHFNEGKVFVSRVNQTLAFEWPQPEAEKKLGRKKNDAAG